jgi:hypothetical protein
MEVSISRPTQQSSQPIITTQRNHRRENPRLLRKVQDRDSDRNNRYSDRALNMTQGTMVTDHTKKITPPSTDIIK